MIKLINDKINTYYTNFSIKKKLLILNFSIILLISIILGTYSQSIYSRNIIKETSKIYLRDTIQIQSSIESLKKNIIDVSTSLSIDTSIQKILKLNSDDYSNMTKNNIHLFNSYMESISSLLISKEYISFIGIYGDNGLNYYVSKDGSSGIRTLNEVKSTSTYKDSFKLKGSPLWITLDKDDASIIVNNKNSKIALVRTILDMNTYETKGFMIVCINKSTIDNIYLSTLQSKEDSFFLVDHNFNLITQHSNLLSYSKISDQLKASLTELQGNKIITIDKQKLLLTYTTIQKNNWKIFRMIPIKTLSKSTNNIIFMTFLVVLICLVIGFCLSLYTSQKVTTPIKQLLISMERVKNGNFKDKVNYKSNDEIGKLAIQYNSMIDNINLLINQVYMLEIKEKEAELKALQSQINPHFLYNTLDSILWKAERENQKEISEMLFALSNIFKLSLNRGNSFTTVENEKSFIDSYILLQQKRFTSKLEYSIQFDDKISNYTIPKLILQPFVENAIIHGTEKSTSETFISIIGYYEDQKLHFIIEDNGIGIDKETLNNILHFSKFKVNITNKSYAISNVIQRLYLYYEKDYYFNIESSVGDGTIITIVLPVKNFN